MADIVDQTLHLTSPGTSVTREGLALLVEVAEYPAGLPRPDRTRAAAIGWRRMSLPIDQLDSVCVFDPAITFSPGAQELCLDHGVAVNFLREYGRLLARFTGVADRSAAVRRTQFRAADTPGIAATIARSLVAGRLQNSRNLLLRAILDTSDSREQQRLRAGAEELARHLHDLARLSSASMSNSGIAHVLRGLETAATDTYFGIFDSLLKPSQPGFVFKGRIRRSPPDRVNSLLNFVYGMVLHDCTAAVSAMGLDPAVGFLHAERPNRPALALDLMEEFRPWLADQLVIELIRRKQLGAEHFCSGAEGAVELSDAGGEVVVTAYQRRKEETLHHPFFDRAFQIGQIPVVQARLLARFLQGEAPEYTPLILKG